MNKENNIEKAIVILFWMLYSFLCIYFYLERSTYADSGYYIFTIIQQKTFCLQHGRYGAILIQWLPVLAVNAGCSLKIVLIAFSICPVIFYFILFHTIRKVSTEKWVGYIFLLSITATIHHSFFNLNSEMVHGSALLIVLAAVLQSKKITNLQKIIYALVITITLIFLHIFLIAIALLIIAISFLHKPSKELVIIISVALLLFLAKKLIITDGYEANALQSFDWRAITLRNMHSSFFPVFFFNAVVVYFQIPVFFVVLLYSKSDLSKKMVITLLLVIIALYIILMLYLRNGAMKAYVDSYNAIIFYFTWAVLVLIIKDESISKEWNVFLIIIFIVSFGRLFSEKEYTNRGHYLQHLMRDNPVKQIYLYQNMPEGIKSMSWSVPYETLLISSLGGETKTILIKESFYKIDEYLSDSTKFLGAEWTFPKQIKLNERYFRLKKGLYVLKE